MSMQWDAAPAGQSAGSRCRGGRPGRWRLTEIALMILGFMVFWPLGAAVIAFKIWQQRSGYPGDMTSLCQDSWEHVRSHDWSAWTSARGFRGWACGGPGRRPGARRTGNAAFDDWRDTELARLEEERRKLEAAEREFSEFMENLRRARDREEFDRFMRERNGGTAGRPTP